MYGILKKQLKMKSEHFSHPNDEQQTLPQANPPASCCAVLVCFS